MIFGKWPTWRTILFYVFISIRYMFRATSCSSSGESIVSIQHLVHVALCRWPTGRRHRVTYTRCCIDTIDSPDDEHEVARNSLCSQSSIFPQPSKRVLSWWSSGTSLYLFLTKFDEILFCFLFFIVHFSLIYISLSSRSGLFSCFLSRLCFRVFFAHFLSVFLSFCSILFLYSSPLFSRIILSSLFTQFISSFFFCLLFNYSSISSSSFLFQSVLLIFPCCLQHWFTF